MKFNYLNESEVIKSGDIESNKVSIDKNNIDFIITILSSNLYSKPISSFLREIVSNAWDSHIEAGVTEPVIIEIGEDTEGEYFCRIQDFGIGLSEERFNSIYKNIGSSTKREDTNQIGFFGIGRFAALAYSDVVHITSNFEGQQYNYMMYKDGNKLSIDLLQKQETSERNGLGVTVNIKKRDVSSFLEAIREQLSFFENLYFVNSCPSDGSYFDREVKNFTHKFNNLKIKKYNNFFVKDLGIRYRVDILLGKVSYPLRIDNLNKYYPDWVRNLPISLKFDIGALEVTPNREEILYSNRTIKAIETVLDKAVEEIEDLAIKESSKNHTDFFDFIKLVKEKPSLTLMGEEVYNSDSIVKIPLTGIVEYFFNGVKYNRENFRRIYSLISKFEGVKTTKVLPTKIYSSSTYQSISSLIGSKVYLCNVTSLTQKSKSYLRYLSEHNLVLLPTNRKLKQYYKKYIKMLKEHEGADYIEIKPIVKTIFKGIYDNYISKITVFDNSSVPKDYVVKIEETKKTPKINLKENLKINILKKGRRGGITIVSNNYSIDNLFKHFKGGLVIFGENGNNKLRDLAEIFVKSSKGYKNLSQIPTLIEVAPTRKKILKEIPNFVDIEDLNDIFKYKLLRKIGTAKLILQEIPSINRISKISNLDRISKDLKQAVNTLNDYVDFYLGDYPLHLLTFPKIVEESFELCSEKNYFDESMKAILNTWKDKINNIKFLLNFNTYNYIPSHHIDFVIDYILARKIFRPDIEEVKSAKTNISQKKIK